MGNIEIMNKQSEGKGYNVAVHCSRSLDHMIPFELNIMGNNITRTLFILLFTLKYVNKQIMVILKLILLPTVIQFIVSQKKVNTLKKA